jgi:hypothetical protein
MVKCLIINLILLVVVVQFVILTFWLNNSVNVVPIFGAENQFLNTDEWISMPDKMDYFCH